jgi:hypothetical protein
MTTLFLRDSYHDPDICQDGETTRRPMLLMDGRPGFARLSDAQVAERRSVRQSMIDRATEAWRMDARKKPPPDPDEDDDDDDEIDPRDARNAARDGYIARLQDAWRHPPTRDAGTPPDELMRRHLRGNEPDADVARKQQAYAAYVDRLSQAWRNPPHAAVPAPAILASGPKHRVVEPTDPSAAASIERLGEKTRGGK